MLKTSSWGRNSGDLQTIQPTPGYTGLRYSWFNGRPGELLTESILMPTDIDAHNFLQAEIPL